VYVCLICLCIYLLVILCKVQVNVVGKNLLITFSKMSPYLLNQKQEVIPQPLEPAYRVKMVDH